MELYTCDFPETKILKDMRSIMGNMRIAIKWFMVLL